MGGGLVLELGKLSAGSGVAGKVVDSEEGVWYIRGGGRRDAFGEVVLNAFPEAVAFKALEGGFSSGHCFLVVQLVLVDKLEVGLHGDISPSISF
jgi:hypothetical protein